MAKRGKKKGSRRGRGKRKGSKRSVPKTVGGVWRAQPLLVKGGLALTALEIATAAPASGPSASAALFYKGTPMDQRVNQVGNALKENAMDLGSYKPLAYAVVAHFVAKKVGIKGL